MSLAGRVALVSGASRGVGRAIALALAEDGADVAVNYRREAAEAEAVVKAIEAMGRRAKAYQASVDDYAQDKAMVDQAVADFGRIDILVHNAGIASRGQSVVDTDPTEPQRLFATHAQAAHHLAALCVPHMRQNPRGDVVVISSVATLSHAANGAPYNMAKAALEALALTLMKEERGNGIYVNIVAPGLVDTDMGQRLAKAAMGAADIHMLDKNMPFGHVCQPEEVASVVRFLVSPANTYVTGEKINVHGGGQR
ncbi:SDR family NAD(P)-dependent oxidoreductase [Phenylobacterium soli]|uniref:D-xylose 1-dehydrogenase n=1 Tax=Phenylobacterium soli TaxID=2170551 RepID=A0A328ARI8_9CAUL|nr:SDR family oxidoreductase [Phenylobacterium soli]RAK55558.1 oxidoreductase [Phenylobacterium soli]